MIGLGPREVVWIVAGLLALYAVMQLGRLHGLRRARRGLKRAVREVGATPPAPAAFGLELEVQQLRREVAQLRDAQVGIDAVWQEAFRRVEVDLGRLREVLETMQAERSVSPQYGEAMVLARRGLTAEAMAERCGISVAEAALVRSLVQREDAPPGEET